MGKHDTGSLSARWRLCSDASAPLPAGKMSPWARARTCARVFVLLVCRCCTTAAPTLARFAANISNIFRRIGRLPSVSRAAQRCFDSRNSSESENVVVKMHSNAGLVSSVRHAVHE